MNPPTRATTTCFLCKANPPARGFRICRACFRLGGYTERDEPVPREEEPKTREEPMTVEPVRGPLPPDPQDFYAMPKDAPWTGTVCGCTKPRGEFYDSWGGKCKECRKKDDQERRLKRRQGEPVKKAPEKHEKQSTDQPPPKRPSPAENENPEPKLPYACPKHGPHAGFVVGGNPTKSCPVCVKEKRDASLRRSFEVQIKIDLSEKPFLYSVLEAVAREAGMTPADWILSRAVASIHPDHFKGAVMQSLQKP